MFDPRYEAQVRLLLRCLPEINRYPCFALKGGTAINLFLQDLPRVSVDIDLTYLPLNSGHEAISEIHGARMSVKENITQHFPSSQVRENRIEDFVVKLLAINQGLSQVLKPGFF